jgi:hypothetical protein
MKTRLLRQIFKTKSPCGFARQRNRIALLTRSSSPSFKKNLAVLIVLLTSIVVFPACTGLGDRDEDKSNEFDTAVTLIAATNKDTYSQTEPITITATVIVLRRDGATVSLDRGGGTPLARYQIAILDEQGKPVSPTPEELRLESARRHHMQYPVDQDNPDRESFRVDTWFDLSKPGKYILVLNRPAWIPKAINLTSNPVSFTRLP